eukprot:m.521030 g.521030  ORF g.521030 m.521030 type:complete len:86 (+) comp57498_c0_seq10:775-1032(+)
MIPLSKAEIIHPGEHVTVVGYGSQIQVLRAACATAEQKLGVSCELIDLRTIVPWDEETIINVRSALCMSSFSFLLSMLFSCFCCL